MTDATKTARGPGRPRLRSVEEEQRLVIDAATRLFARDGFEGASIEAIAQEAGVNRPNVYEHFGSKDGLVEAVVADVAAIMADRLVSTFTEHRDGEAWPDVVRRSFEAVFELTAEHPEAATVALLSDRQAPPGSPWGLAGARQQVLAALAQRSRELWESVGAEVGVSAEVFALMIYSMGEAVAYQQLEKGWDRDALIDLLTAFTNGGLIALFRDDFAPLTALDG